MGSGADLLDYKRIAGDFSIAVIGQGANAFASAALTLLLPGVLGVDGFGYWQLFIFYVGYVGFFHLGINDGVYLIEGGIPRKEIDKKKVNTQFVFSFCAQLIVSSLVMVAALLLPMGSERGFVVFATGLAIVVCNAGLFLGYVFQAMGETRLFSLSALIESLILLIGVVVLVFLGESRFELYIFLYLAAKVVRLVFSCCCARDFFVAGVLSFRSGLSLCWSSIGVGMKLMISNIAGSLTLGLARFFIDAKWGIETFSAVSFALSICSFVMLFISQASMVLFPALRRSDGDESKAFFSSSRDLLNVILPLVYLLYPLAALVIEVWFPDYLLSISVLCFVFPLCVFEGKMSLLGTTFLKVQRKETVLLLINLGSLACCGLLSFAGVYFFESVAFALLSTVLVLGFRELVSECFLARTNDTFFSWMSVGAMVVSVGFVELSLTLSPMLATAFYCLLLVVYYAVFFSKTKRAFQSIVGKLFD